MRITFFGAIVVCFLLATALTAQDDINKLIDGVSSKDKKACLDAIGELSKLGPDAKPAVDALIKALGQDDTEVCWHAARTLGSIGPDAKMAVPALMKALSSDDGAVRAYSAFALGRIGKAAMPAADELIKHAFDKDELVRRATMRALLSIDPPQEKTLPLVLEILEKGDISIIMPALHSMAELGKEAVPRMREVLNNQDAKPAHYWACLVLAEIGPDAAPAVPELTKLLKDDDPDMRLQVLVALGDIGEAARPATDAVLAAFNSDPFEHVRYAAAYCLRKMKAKGSPEAALRKAMESDDEFLRTLSAWALARMNPDDKQLVRRAVTLIVGAFKSKDVNVRQAAARAVVEFDVDPQLVAPALVDALQDKDPSVVANAIEALSSFGPQALEHIDDALKNKALRHYAIRLIARMGPRADSAVPALMDALKQKPQDEADLEFRREVQFALGTIGPAAKDAVRELINSLSSDDEKIRASAMFALGKIGRDARAAVPMLRKSLASGTPIERLASVRALLEIQPGQRQLEMLAAPLLLRALTHENEFIRAEAANAVGQLGQRVKRQAVPLLKKMLDDESELVQQAAKDALEKLGA